ncbi:hypothetical protein TM51_15096 [Thermobifida fusca TM51]|uniref:Uncharacterized protein n=1 Tax=Thermobifida fusca TM51 TaxID=1169414 RepID=A0A9P2WNC2_THEFU|nr:hypothetical protein TM51_15096 [Thermobifida fusca TM51]
MQGLGVGAASITSTAHNGNPVSRPTSGRLVSKFVTASTPNANAPCGNTVPNSTGNAP